MSLTSALFIFQACYGSMQDFGLDTFISGNVKSKTTGAPIKGIKVSINDQSQYETTDAYGNFTLYTEEADSYKILFQDIDLTNNGLYSPKDTLITKVDVNKFLEIALEAI